MTKGYGLIYAWEIFPPLAVMTVLLGAVPAVLHGSWILITGKPKNLHPNKFEAFATTFTSHIPRKYYGHSKIENK